MVQKGTMIVPKHKNKLGIILKNGISQVIYFLFGCVWLQLFTFFISEWTPLKMLVLVLFFKCNITSFFSFAL